MGSFITLTAADGTQVPAYVAQPAAPAKAAVVVIQEIFGVNTHIREVADAYASEGYLAIAPAMFHRVQANVELGYAEADMGLGMGLKTAVEALPAPGALQDIQAAIDHAHTQDVIAHRAHAGAGRARQTGGHHAADRGAHAEVRWLKRQALTVGGQSGLQLGQRRASTGGDEELARLVADDAAVAPRVQDFARQGRAPKVFAATAAQAQLAAVGRGGAHGVDEVLALCFHGLGW